MRKHSHLILSQLSACECSVHANISDIFINSCIHYVAKERSGVPVPVTPASYSNRFFDFLSTLRGGSVREHSQCDHHQLL